MNTIETYLYLNLIFTKYGYKLYIVGGTVRDYILRIESYDLDCATDATPDEMNEFLPDANYRFAKFGTVSLKVDYNKVEITTFRQEKNYGDKRHPNNVKFVKKIELDYVRRDFTINALYIDENKNIIDFCNGISDIRQKTIRVIGDADQRIKEDPLRIIRALRFKLKLGFKLEDSLISAIDNNIELLKTQNQQKLNYEIKKMLQNDKVSAIELLNKYKIEIEDKLLD